MAAGLSYLRVGLQEIQERFFGVFVGDGRLGPEFGKCLRASVEAVVERGGAFHDA